jgi:cyclopropane fatty-acyl-phospholipid synthase-like methyltransferase
MTAPDPVAASYDATPYESRPLQPTHADHIAVVARLCGLEVPRVDQSRVLEIGCATGGNLLPMAVSLPQARFTGLDLSPARIAAGQRIVDELGSATSP